MFPYTCIQSIIWHVSGNLPKPAVEYLHTWLKQHWQKSQKSVDHVFIVRRSTQTLTFQNFCQVLCAEFLSGFVCVSIYTCTSVSVYKYKALTFQNFCQVSSVSNGPGKAGSVLQMPKMSSTNRPFVL